MSDELPDWAAPFKARQLFWEKYGIRSDDDWTFEEIVLAMLLHGAENRRKQYEQEKAERANRGQG